MLKLIVAVLIAVVLFRIGFVLLRGLARPIPSPPPPGELRKVNVRYRCTLCGTELKVVLATDELPAPPRHCQEEMDVVAPVME